MYRWSGIGLITVLIGGCAGDNTGTTGTVYDEPLSEERVFESPDGRVRLVAAAGTRVPEGGISIEVVDPASLTPGLRDAFAVLNVENWRLASPPRVRSSTSRCALKSTSISRPIPTSSTNTQ